MIKLLKISAVFVPGSVPILEIQENVNGPRVDRTLAVGQDDYSNDNQTVKNFAEVAAQITKPDSVLRIVYSLDHFVLEYKFNDNRGALEPCRKCPDTGNWLETTKEEMNAALEQAGTPCPELVNFASAIYSIEKETKAGKVKLYPRLFQIQQEKLAHEHYKQ